MRIATWNVNSLRARFPRVCDWLIRERPTVLCLQELKMQEEDFPKEEFAALGYHAAVFGQRTYNGVALLAREPLTAVTRGFADGPADEQARLIAATVRGVRVLSAYIPNGATPESPKYVYKREWLARLRHELAQHYSKDEPLALCGDFNIVHRALDTAAPARWHGSVLFNEFLSEWFDELLAWGLTDVFRALHPEQPAYSWWDYRGLSFPRNDGLRIDYVLATAPLTAGWRGASIDRDERKGEKPSDHVPVVLDLGD